MQAYHHPVYGLHGFGSDIPTANGTPTTIKKTYTMDLKPKSFIPPGLKMIMVPLAMGIGYQRTKSIWKAFLLGFVSTPYLVYVAYDTYAKK